ncbi:MAG TPA: helix-turn-helix domain-containing protein [Candidatus Thermoplasmatota archaeon]|nr:helix-turn-helix domain-containing protein [Candidatus Thermoplasmatota archaeon]
MPADRQPHELPSPATLAQMRAAVMPQKEMARAIGVDPGQLSRFESGKGEMSYAKIRRYAHVLHLRTTAADPVAYLVQRIANRVALRELRPMDPLERAVEVMTVHGHAALPVLNARGDAYVGVLTDAIVCRALADGPESALVRPVGSLDLAPLARIASGDPLPRVCATLAENPVALVEDRDGLPAGFAFRHDLYPLATGVGASAAWEPRRPPEGRARRRRA